MLLIRSALIVGVVFGFSVRATDAAELTLDNSQSSIEFVGTKTDGKHKGGFKKFTAQSEANLEEPSKSSLSIEIDAKSIWSDDDKLTNHLKSPDFFDVRNNPTITFESTKIVPGEKDGDKATGTITGKMTMLGKSVEIEVPIKAVVSEATIQISAEFTIDRTKWGMNYGKGKIDDDVKINAEMTFKR